MEEKIVNRFLSGLILGLCLVGTNEVHSATASNEDTDFTTLEGRWFEQDYNFVLHKVWEDVKGSWGASLYSLAWDPYDSELKGRSAGIAQRMAIDDLWGEVRGTAYCGDFDFTYSKKAPFRIEGLFCHQMMERFFDSDEAIKTWIKETMLQEMVVDFPEPTRAQVYDFLYSLVRFERKLPATSL